MAKKTSKGTRDAQSALMLKIDEFASLYNRLAPEIDRLESLKKEIAVEAAKEQAMIGVTLKGFKYELDYSVPRSNAVCTIPIKEYVKHTGAWSTLTISITEARKVLSQEQIDKYFVLKPGARSIKRIRSIV
jgi:hypothetical protein